MSIVRELVTRVSFQVDKKGIEDFNRSIIGFKTRFSLAATAVTGFVLGVVKAAKSVSDSILDTNELARSIGISTDEFIGLQKAAGRFRISQQDFNQGMVFFNDQIRKARFGEGALTKEARDAGFEIRDQNGELLDQVTLLKIVLGFLARIPNLQDRQQKALELLGSKRFADVAVSDIDEFFSLAESLKPLGDEIAKAEESARKFDVALNRILNTAEKFKVEFAAPILEGLATVIEAFNNYFGLLKSFGSNVGSFFRSYRDAVMANFGQPIQTTSPLGQFFNRNSAAPTQQVTNSRPVNNVRVNEITVNIGGEPGAANKAEMANMIKIGFQSAFETVWSEIGNNNPVFE